MVETKGTRAKLPAIFKTDLLRALSLSDFYLLPTWQSTLANKLIPNHFEGTSGGV
jgi:hypothetical protein